MRHALALLAAACTGCDEPDHRRLYVNAMSESRAHCRDRCAIATGTSTRLTVAHVDIDVFWDSFASWVAVDRPDVLAASLAGGDVDVRGLAAGTAVLTIANTLHAEPVTGEQAIEVVDAAAERIVGAGLRSPALAPGAPLRVLPASTVPLLFARVDAAGEPLLGDNPRPWTAAGGASTISPVGVTGVLQRLDAAAPETLTLAVGAVTRRVDVVPVSAIARLALFERSLELSAADGDTLRLQSGTHAFFDVDAFDAAGNYLEGDGDGVFHIASTATFTAPAPRYFIVTAVDQQVTITAGDQVVRVDLDFP